MQDEFTEYAESFAFRDYDDESDALERDVRRYSKAFDEEEEARRA